MENCGLFQMLCQGGANIKKFNKAARKAFISMQGPNLKGSGRKHQKMMPFEGSSDKSKSKRDLSGMPLVGDPLHLK